MLMNLYNVLLFLQHGHVRHNALQGKLFLQVPTQCLMLELCYIESGEIEYLVFPFLVRSPNHFSRFCVCTYSSS